MTDMIPAADYLTNAPRRDGWTAEREVGFLQHFADHGLVTEAARAVGMGLSGAYGRRRSEAGTAFDLGWQAAMLLARQRVADLLMARAIEGEERVTVREEGRTISKSHNYRLGMTLLDRIDPAKASWEVRTVARAFESFLLIIAGGSETADIRDFFESRSTDPNTLTDIRNLFPLPEDSEVFDEDEDEDEGSEFAIWEDEYMVCNYPPPPDFDGTEYGTFGEEGYRRTLSSAEDDALDAEGFVYEDENAAHLKAAHAARKVRFAVTDEDEDEEEDEDDRGYEIKSMAGLSRGRGRKRDDVGLNHSSKPLIPNEDEGLVRAKPRTLGHAKTSLGFARLSPSSSFGMSGLTARFNQISTHPKSRAQPRRPITCMLITATHPRYLAQPNCAKANRV
jgi:hypothetical protein